MAYEDYHVNADDVKLDGDPNIRRTVPPSPSGSGGGISYGTCTTAAATAAKVVTLSDATGWELKQGASIAVKFTYTNTYEADVNDPVQLNVNNSGAKNIYYGDSSNPTGTNPTAFGRANCVNTYVYDGTYWVWAGSSSDNNTTYSAMSESELTTGTATTSRVVRADYLKSAILDLANPIGTVIESTTCDTMAKVIEAYGGTTWVQHSGYMLRGATSGVTANHTGNDGGVDEITPTGSFSGTNASLAHSGGGVSAHTLTAAQTPKQLTRVFYNTSGAWSLGIWGGHGNGYCVTMSDQTGYGTYGQSHSHGHTNPNAHSYTPAGSITINKHSTLPKYKNVYIWERTA
jgi:hypothetical protein